MSDGWYRASGASASFGFQVIRGKVAMSAPYARRWLMGRSWVEARQSLGDRGFTVTKLKPVPRSAEAVRDEIRAALREGEP